MCISSWSHDTEGHAKKCVERYCDLANKTTQQLYEEEIRGRIANSMLSYFSKMLIFGTYRKIWYSRISE